MLTFLALVATTLPITAEFTLPVYSSTSPLISIPITTALWVNNFTFVQDSVNTSLLLATANISLPTLVLSQPALLPGVPVPPAFVESLMNADLPTLSANATTFIGKALAPLLAKGVNANFTLPSSLPFPPRLLTAQIQEGYILISSNLLPPTL